MIPPTERFPAPRGPGNSDGVPLTILGVLGRQGVLGVLLWCGAASDITTRTAVTLIGFCATILWTRWFGLLHPNCWAKAGWEGLLLYIGAVGIGNLLLIGFGVAPWWR